MRLTYKKLIELVNAALMRVEADNLEAFEAYNPRHNDMALENGACSIVVQVKQKGENSFSHICLLCYYSRSELEKEINKGAVIGFKFKDRTNLVNSNAKIWMDAEICPIFLPQN